MTSVAQKRSFSGALLGSTIALAILLAPAEARAASINLVGLNGSGATATVSNYSLIGNVFSFTLINTSATGFITAIGVNLGDIVDTTTFTTNAPFTYTIIHDGATPPDGPGLPANDFFLNPSTQLTGINPGQSFFYQIILTMDDGSPLTGVTADTLANGLGPRVRGLPTPSGADLLVAPSLVTPEPSSFLLLAGGLGALVLRRRLQKRA